MKNNLPQFYPLQHLLSDKFLDPLRLIEYAKFSMAHDEVITKATKEKITKLTDDFKDLIFETVLPEIEAYLQTKISKEKN